MLIKKPLLYSGETENYESKEAQKIAETFDNGIRGALKVDLRICLSYEGKLYDVCNVEFARNGDIQKKCVSDATKVMLEGKCILDQIVRLAKLDDDSAKELQILNLQFCGNFTLYKDPYRALQTFGLINALISILGLKGAIIGIRFEESRRGYVAEYIGRTLRMPTKVQNTTHFFESMVSALLLVRVSTFIINITLPNTKKLKIHSFLYKKKGVC